MDDLSLDAVTGTLKTGNEPFTHQDKEIGTQLGEFWSWSCSDLLSNAMRGVLAE